MLILLAVLFASTVTGRPGGIAKEEGGKTLVAVLKEGANLRVAGPTAGGSLGVRIELPEGRGTLQLDLRETGRHARVGAPGGEAKHSRDGLNLTSFVGPAGWDGDGAGGGSAGWDGDGVGGGSAVLVYDHGEDEQALLKHFLPESS